MKQESTGFICGECQVLMATAKEILKIAKDELGYKEYPANSNKTKFGAYMGLDGYPWCMSFIQWCFAKAGASTALPVKTGSCGSLMSAAKKAGAWVTSGYKPGDVLIYDFPGNSVKTDHCGICESATAGYVTAIEGNTSTSNQANGGQVMRRVRKVGLVLGAVRPKFDALKSDAIVAQEILDGKWGNGKERKNGLYVAGYDFDTIQQIVNALAGKNYKLTVTASVLNVRSAPTTESEIKDKILNGATVSVQEIRNGKGSDSGWGKLSDGRGWISLDYTAAV